MYLCAGAEVEALIAVDIAQLCVLSLSLSLVVQQFVHDSVVGGYVSFYNILFFFFWLVEVSSH